MDGCFCGAPARTWLDRGQYHRDRVSLVAGPDRALRRDCSRVCAVESRRSAVTCRSGGADCERRLSLPLSPRRPSFRFSSPLIEPDVRISRIRLSDGFHIKACARDARTNRSAPAWPSRRALVGASGSFRELLGSRQSPSPRLVRARPEPGPLPSTGVTQLPRYYGPLRRLPRPSPKGLVPGLPAARQASRVASHRVRTCYAHYPGEPSDLHVSVYPIAHDGLRPMRGDSALAFNLSGPAQASLALRPVRSLTRPRRISVPEASTGRSPFPPPG